MGLLDHRKTWRFRVKGSPDDCIGAFRAAFSGGAHLMKAKWSVDRNGDTATATYQGRAGLMKGLTILSSRASDEEEAAVGSEVTFEVEEATTQTTTCAMWLSTKSSAMGFTSDGRFFRPYMRAVELHLRNIDPSVQVQKG